MGLELVIEGHRLIFYKIKRFQSDQIMKAYVYLGYVPDILIINCFWFTY